MTEEKKEMEKIKKAWAEFLPYERVFYVLGMVSAVTAIIFAAISFWWHNAVYIYQPAMCLMLLSQGVYSWRRSKIVAIFSFCAAGIVGIVYTAITLMEIFG